MAIHTSPGFQVACYPVQHGIQSQGTSEKVMADRFELEVINPRVAQKDNNGLRNRTTVTCPIL
jgi:hypothetical protein